MVCWVVSPWLIQTSCAACPEGTSGRWANVVITAAPWRGGDIFEFHPVAHSGGGAELQLDKIVCRLCQRGNGGS